MQFPFQMSAPRMSLAKTKKESPQAKLCFLYNLHKEKKPGRGVRSERTYRSVGRSENPGGGVSSMYCSGHNLLPPICKYMGGQSPPPLVPTTIPWRGAEYICPRAFNVRINFYGARTKKKITEGFFIDDLGASPSRQFWTKSVRCTLRVSKSF